MVGEHFGNDGASVPTFLMSSMLGLGGTMSSMLTEACTRSLGLRGVGGRRGRGNEGRKEGEGEREQRERINTAIKPFYTLTSNITMSCVLESTTHA